MASCLLAGVVLSAPLCTEAQTSTPAPRKRTGQEPTQHIDFARVYLDGRMVPAGSPPEAQSVESRLHPVLIAQCTRNAAGRYRFELLLHFLALDDETYVPPWRSTGPNDLFPPQTEKTNLVFDFFGYTHVKPVKRQWEIQIQPTGMLRYNTPGGGSSNMEEITFWLQYLKALPTLRITQGTYAAQFETTAWLAAIHAEPLCRVSGV